MSCAQQVRGPRDALAGGLRGEQGTSQGGTEHPGEGLGPSALSSQQHITSPVAGSRKARPCPHMGQGPINPSWAHPPQSLCLPRASPWPLPKALHLQGSGRDKCPSEAWCGWRESTASSHFLCWSESPGAGHSQGEAQPGGGATPQSGEQAGGGRVQRGAQPTGAQSPGRHILGGGRGTAHHRGAQPGGGGTLCGGNSLGEAE